MSEIHPLPRAAKKKTRGSSALVRFGKRIRPKINRILAANSKIGDRPVFDRQLFPFLDVLEEKSDIIAAEAKKVLAERNGVHPLGDVSPDHRRIAHDRRWKSFFLIGYGYRLNHNCERCPETTRLLEQVPGLNSGFFSILEAGATIPRHKGVTKAILSGHLGLSIPKDRMSCAIKVDDQTCHWENGKAFVFDDTFHHEAWNRTDEDRVILLLQFKRPMRFWGRLLGNLFLGGVRASTFVQDARKNMVAKDQALGMDASSSRLR